MVAGTRQIPGVTEVTSNALDHRLTVRYDPAVTSEPIVVAAIDRVVDVVVR